MNEQRQNKVHPGEVSKLKDPDQTISEVGETGRPTRFPSFEKPMETLGHVIESSEANSEKSEQSSYPEADQLFGNEKFHNYGKLDFCYRNSAVSNAPFIKVAANLDESDVVKLVSFIQKKWQLPDPSLIISVTGGAASFAMKKKDHERLRQALQRIVATDGSWLVTGGSNCGIMKICGEAVMHQLLNSPSPPSRGCSLVQLI